MQDLVGIEARPSPAFDASEAAIDINHGLIDRTLDLDRRGLQA
jgi:hypothetical protein